MSESPKQLGYVVPPEWTEHAAVWMAWPHDTESFPGEKLAKVEKTYIAMISALLPSERVNLLVVDGAMQSRVLEMFNNQSVDTSDLKFYQVAHADVWTRDYGPIFTKNKEQKKFLKFNYDAYNKKFPALFRDNEIFNELEGEVGESIKVDFVLEGGAVETNGEGVLMTTEECLIENRNPGLTKEENEKVLLENFGAEKVIWLKKGLLNDHTDGHIDEVARFVAPNKILLAWEEEETSPNFERMKENYNILQNNKTLKGEDFEIIKLPLPHMQYDDGTIAPASYANFYIGNTVVLASQFNDPNDAKAIEILQTCFPDKKVVGIDCTDLIYGGGAIHCVTIQEPK
ncbi:MAG: agmatine/peptidylarginine deiminase [Candidatus Paceibacterota bacterium]